MELAQPTAANSLLQKALGRPRGRSAFSRENPEFGRFSICQGDFLEAFTPQQGRLALRLLLGPSLNLRRLPDMGLTTGRVECAFEARLRAFRCRARPGLQAGRRERTLLLASAARFSGLIRQEGKPAEAGWRKEFAGALAPGLKAGPTTADERPMNGPSTARFIRKWLLRSTV